MDQFFENQTKKFRKKRIQYLIYKKQNTLISTLKECHVSRICFLYVGLKYDAILSRDKALNFPRITAAGLRLKLTVADACIE